MLKNESARNPTKPTPLRPARLPDSGGIIFMSNGVRMEKLSRSDRKVKQAKKMLTGQDTWHVRTVTRGRFRTVTRGRFCTGHVADRTGHVASPERDTCQADLAFSAHTWTNPGVTRVTTGRVTRGTDDVSIIRR
jgi:hypothetical protein